MNGKMPYGARHFNETSVSGVWMGKIVAFDADSLRAYKLQ